MRQLLQLIWIIIMTLCVWVPYKLWVIRRMLWGLSLWLIHIAPCYCLTIYKIAYWLLYMYNPAIRKMH